MFGDCRPADYRQYGGGSVGAGGGGGRNWEAARRELGQNLRNNGQPVAWMQLPAPSKRPF
jgi:hypothetical protein